MRRGTTAISVFARAEAGANTSFAVLDNVTLASTGSTAVTLSAWQPATGAVTTSVTALASFASGYGAVTALRSTLPDRSPSYDSTFEQLPPNNFTFEPVAVISGPGDVVVQLDSATSATPRRSLVQRASFTAFPSTLALAVGVDTLPLLWHRLAPTGCDRNSSGPPRLHCKRTALRQKWSTTATRAGS